MSEAARPSPQPSPASGRGSTCALVTGGSAGIGRAICERLLGDGATVLSLDRAAGTIDHPRLHAIEVDLVDRAATAEVAADIARRFDVTTVVHNAGVIRPASLAHVQLADLDALVELHLASAIALVQSALPAMRAAHFGRIVLISSRAALGLPTRTVYSATKAGLIGMARTWALELAPEGITVNVVAPGPIRTAMFHDVIASGSERERELAASVPVRRLGEADDVARAVSFFADAGSGFVTGQVLYVCGGTSVGSLVL
jgi:3-oxoacyl-[acyl-carrier protein] reductase